MSVFCSRWLSGSAVAHGMCGHPGCSCPERQCSCWEAQTVVSCELTSALQSLKAWESRRKVSLV